MCANQFQNWFKEGNVEKQQQGDGPGFLLSRWSGPKDQPNCSITLLVWLMYEFIVAVITSEKFKIIIQIIQNYPLVKKKSLNLNITVLVPVFCPLNGILLNSCELFKCLNGFVDGLFFVCCLCYILYCWLFILSDVVYYIKQHQILCPKSLWMS